MKKFLLLTSFFLLFLTSPAQAETLQKYISYFYNRYSQNFDDQGLVFAIPDYGIKTFQTAKTAREIISLGSYYKFRSLDGDKIAKNKLASTIISSVDEIEKRTSLNLSFNDAEALFLNYTISQQIPNLLETDNQVRLNQLIISCLKGGIMAPDTENRALVAAAHWQTLLNEMFKNKFINEGEKKNLDELNAKKIKSAIKQSISENGWYREGKIFVPHYHAVSAFMLLSYGISTNNTTTIALSKKMYQNLKQMSFSNGSIEAKIGHRPTGLGAQFYLMMGVMGKYFNDNDYSVYLNYAKGDAFFKDKKNPNRLEYHCTSCKLPTNFHDDYAFSDVAELSNYILKNTDLETNENSLYLKNWKDDEFSINRYKNYIIISDKKRGIQIKALNIK